MATIKLTPSKRARAAIAAVVLSAGAAGTLALMPGAAPVPDDVALAVTVLVKPWEGRSLQAYLDTIAKPPVWTICDGDTAGVRPGMVETAAGCDRRLANRIVRDYRARLTACIPNWSAAPLGWRAMMTSLAWNIGTDAACRSTAARLGRAGRWLESCVAATAFNRAGGRMVVGLARRRGMGDAARIGEGELCASGLL
ncbi:glycoside hydrolase [Pleomorphomonas diazotrophica]|uniref:Lysozyme n=1 Tax=Pleomorphomonas diazotrophica TaxID=1166257 RepID=A0A1I4V5K8_9HYPH|nr:lysozyme [Pleomorphomonas diazotrophica]PKR87414.1 glycoside hydrolase [Pleomorphomonas diazotrophica]SFM96514.1 Phage-related lysozyme (muramidase), GH24 family [Pleomorphomonas diazotrophica]